MKIEILGGGCDKCATLYKSAQQAAVELGVEADFVKVEDFAEIMKYGVMTTPALVVDGKVVSLGKVLSKDEVVKLLQKVRG